MCGGGQRRREDINLLQAGVAIAARLMFCDQEYEESQC
jgi:hypothetical protein